LPKSDDTILYKRNLHSTQTNILKLADKRGFKSLAIPINASGKC